MSKRARIAIAGFQHETNTFSPLPTEYDNFVQDRGWPGLTLGPDVVKVFAPLNIPIGGFMGEAIDMDHVPILWASAEPGGHVTNDAFDRITARLCDDILKAGAIDGIYLDLHGAMVTESYEDGEAEVVKRLRAALGKDIPIAVSLDLHGNISPDLFDAASSLTIYRTYPHIDMAETGARSAKLLRQQLERGEPFDKAFRQIDFLIPLPAQSTMSQPGKQLYDDMAKMKADGLLSIDFAMGFPPADITHCSPSLVAYGTDQAAANEAADLLKARIDKAEKSFENPMMPARDAVKKAMEMVPDAAKPVVIADPQDNPGAGATGDTTGLLQALLKGKAKGACLAMLWDPKTAAKAHEVGVGGLFKASLGGQFPDIGGAAIEVEVWVENLSDGTFRYTGPMYGPGMANLGPMALLRILDDASDVQVIVATSRTQNADQAVYTHLGVEPASMSILAIKSSVHFMADYQPIAHDILFADAPGANPCNLTSIPFENLREGLRLEPMGPEFSKK